jgi:hypothetical protein
LTNWYLEPTTIDRQQHNNSTFFGHKPKLDNDMPAIPVFIHISATDEAGNVDHCLSICRKVADCGQSFGQTIDVI